MRILALLAVVMAAVSCEQEPPEPSATGEALVGPVSLELFEVLGVRSRVSATVHHGERVEIIETRRSFRKVRTAGGDVGWTGMEQLMTPAQVARLRRLRERARQMPVQGRAMPFARLNIHTRPHRDAPTIYQIPEHETAAVVGQAVTPRLPYVPESPQGYNPALVTPETARDDWLLLVLDSGHAGWALSRQLLFLVPDEVAQFAEGAKITSYFSLGSVDDEGERRQHWLWTTLSEPYQPYDFDSLRVFLWNPARHRYETWHIERNLTGYYPVTVEAPPADSESLPGFSVIVRNDDGELERRSYEFRGRRPRVVAREPWTEPMEDLVQLGAADEAEEAPPPGEPSFWERIRENWDRAWQN